MAGIKLSWPGAIESAHNFESDVNSSAFRLNQGATSHKVQLERKSQNSSQH